MPVCALAEWTADRGCEPRIRVGIVLPTDGMQSLRMDLPEGRFELRADGREPARLSTGTCTLGVEADRVTIAGSGAEVRAIARGQALRILPLDPPSARAGGGIRLHEVLTGRGFHWQKRVAFTLEGTLDIRAYAGHLLVVNELPAEQYLQGVITAEMSGECPLEFLKSQCIVARSWVLARSEPKHTDWPIDRCNDDCCQRYHGTTHLTARAVLAVAETRGQVLADASGRIIDANYSKSCGGIIEAPEHVWFTPKACLRAAVDAPAGASAHRFLPITAANLDEFLTGGWLATTDAFCSPNVVPDSDLPRYLGSVDEGGGHFRWRIEYTRPELENLLRRKLAHVFDVGEPPAGAGIPSRTQGQQSPGVAVLVADLPPARIEACVPPMARLCELRVTRRGTSGRASEMQIVYEDVAGQAWTLLVRSEYRIREVLHERFLYSSAFQVEVDRGRDGVPVKVRLLGAGWGHGAGLCQIGALGMALKGYVCHDILRHYFERVEIRALY